MKLRNTSNNTRQAEKTGNQAKILQEAFFSTLCAG